MSESLLKIARHRGDPNGFSKLPGGLLAFCVPNVERWVLDCPPEIRYTVQLFANFPAGEYVEMRDVGGHHKGTREECELFVRGFLHGWLAKKPEGV